jgi:hypothetical protein
MKTTIRLMIFAAIALAAIGSNAAITCKPIEWHCANNGNGTNPSGIGGYCWCNRSSIGWVFEHAFPYAGNSNYLERAISECRAGCLAKCAAAM